MDTYYKLEDDGLLSIKMEADYGDVSLFEQLAVIYEVCLYKLWIPFMTDSQLIAQLSNTHSHKPNTQITHF